MAYLKAAKKSNVVDDVFDQLLAGISAKTWPEGTKIPSENELAQTFRVSRFSVRTAIQRLIALGILTSYQGGGTYVASQDGRQAINPLIAELAVNPKSVAELLELRRSIEVSICEYAAQRADAEDMRRLEELLRTMSFAAEQNNIHLYCRADLDFHIALAHASKNSIFIYIFDIIKDTIFTHFINQTTLFGVQCNLPFHFRIYDAIVKRDPELAVAHMRDNLNKVSELVNSRRPSSDQGI